MNRVKKVLSVFMMILLIGFSSHSFLAETVSQDGIEVSIQTDKDEYLQDEEIEISLNIKNTNSYKIEGVLVETVLPEELELKTGNLCIDDVQIEAGKEYITSFTAELSEELRDNPSDDENLPSENPDSEIPEKDPSDENPDSEVPEKAPSDENPDSEVPEKDPSTENSDSNITDSETPNDKEESDKTDEEIKVPATGRK